MPFAQFCNLAYARTKLARATRIVRLRLTIRYRALRALRSSAHFIRVSLTHTRTAIKGTKIPCPTVRRWPSEKHYTSTLSQALCHSRRARQREGRERWPSENLIAPPRVSAKTDGTPNGNRTRVTRMRI